MGLTPVDLVEAHPWQRVAFTTYALSLSFFEAVILDALVRGAGRSQPFVLADVDGVRASISEQGAHRVGKDYEVEPVAVTNGVFHAKVSVFTSADECHVLVGSGNLTFGGWGGNCEVLEHLHTGFAADAIADTAGFFERICENTRVRHGAAAHCADIAADLRRSAQGRAGNGDIRLLHNLDRSIAEQVAAAAADLGGAHRLVAAAPFWDSGGAIDRLCDSLNLQEVFVHSHIHGSVTGPAGDNWPRGAKKSVHPVRVGVMDTSDEAARLLHAKAFELLCKRGRLLISGSANGTAAALDASHNVETCVIRIQRERSIGWSYVEAEPPDPPVDLGTELEGDETHVGVLRAILDADEVTGRVLTPRMSGTVSVYHLGNTGPAFLMTTPLAPDGAFKITAPDLEPWAMRGGRLVIRVQDGRGRHAEGFVSVASFADIRRRAGLVGRRLLALIAGNETPADVAAILNWFHEDPRRLAPSDPNDIRGGGEGEKGDDSDRLVTIAALGRHYAVAFAATKTQSTTAHRNWSRFIEQILAAFRDPRGPLEDKGTGRAIDDDDESREDSTEPQGEDPAIGKSLNFFTKLFNLLTKDGAPTRNVLTAFDLTQYVCDRLRPELAQAKGWLEQLIRVLLDSGVPLERRDDVAAAILVALGIEPNDGRYRWARSCLLRLGADFANEPPTADGVRGYQAILLQQATFTELWARLAALHTFPEQVASYRQALEEGTPSDDYPDLSEEVREEWPLLEAALTSPQARRRIVFTSGSHEVCPCCHIRLPSCESYKLRSRGIATAKNCCSRIVIWQRV